MSDDIRVQWADNSNNEDGFRVYRSRDGGSTWTQVSGDLAPGTTQFDDVDLLDGEEYVHRVDVVTEHTTTESATTTAVTTDLPAAQSPSLSNGVEDEIEVTWPDVIDYGEYVVQIRETGQSTWDSNATGFAEQAVAQSTASTVFQGLEDGEEYEVRLKTQTEHVTDSPWTTPVAIVAKFPGAQNLQLTPVSTTQIDGTFDDVSDNEDGFEVFVAEENDPLRDTGFGAFELDQTLGPNTTSFSLTGLQSNHAYRVFVRAFTEHTEADTSTAETTTEIDYPIEGWFVVLEDGAGDKATVPHDVIDESRPMLQPETSAVGRWTIDLVPNDILREWLRSEAYIYYDGSLWMRGPFTRYHPDGGSGDAAAQLEGLGIIQHLKGGGTVFDVTSEPGYQALERFVANELPDWTLDMTPPGSDTIDEDWQVQSASTTSKFESILTLADTDPFIIENGGVRPAKTAIVKEGENADDVSNAQTFIDVDAYTNEQAAYLSDGDASESLNVYHEWHIENEHTIPQDAVGVWVRDDALSGDTPAVTWYLNGTEIDHLSAGAGIFLSWGDMAQGNYSTGTWSGGDLPPDVQEIRVELTYDVWDSGTGYENFDYVFHNGDVWQAQTDTPVWDSGTQYFQGDYVNHNGSIWEALQDDQGTEPGTDSNVWSSVSFDTVWDSSGITHDYQVDVVALVDNRFYDGNFDNEVHEVGGHLDGPRTYAPATVTFDPFSQEYNVSAATVNATIDDISGSQRLQASNDGGTTWLPNDGTEANTTSATADFAAAEVYGTAIRGRATLGGYEPNGPRNQTPRLGYEPQTLTDWEIRLDTTALRVVDDMTYTGNPFSIIGDIASDSGLEFVPDYREDELALKSFAPGDEVRDLRDEWTVVDNSPVDTTEGYFNQLTVFGPEPDDGSQRPSVTASSQAEIDRVGRVPGPADFRPDATTEAELVSIARTRLAEGIAKDTVTGTLDIVSQFVQPGYAYKIDEFAKLDPRDDPAYVLQSARWEWGTMTLDFEGRNDLAQAIQAIETDVRITKRAL